MKGFFREHFGWDFFCEHPVLTERHFVWERALKGYFELLFDEAAAASRRDDATGKIAYPKLSRGMLQPRGMKQATFKGLSG